MKTRITRVKEEIRTFSSRTPDGVLMYPGNWRCTYVEIVSGVWFMVAMEAVE